MGVRKEKKGWVADLSVKKPNGQYTHKFIEKNRYRKTKKEAEQDMIWLVAEYKNKDGFSKNITFIEVLNEWLIFKKKRVDDMSYSKLEAYAKNHFLPIFNNQPIIKITTKDIIFWQNYMINKDLSNTFINKVMMYLKSIFKYALTVDYVQKDPFFFITNLKKEKKTIYNILDISQYQKLDETIVKTERNEFKKIMYRFAFHLMFFYGVRVGELLAIQLKKIIVSDDSIIIQIRHTCNQKKKGVRYELKPAKADSERDISLTSITQTMFNEYLSYLKLVEGYNPNFFLFKGVYPLGNTTMSEDKNKYFKHANLTPITFREFRHSYTSNMYYNTDIKLKDLSLSLGHSKTVITENTYTHQLKNESTKYIEQLQNISKFE